MSLAILDCFEDKLRSFVITLAEVGCVFADAYDYFEGGCRLMCFVGDAWLVSAVGFLV